MLGEESKDAGLSLVEEVRREQYEAVDRLRAEIVKRSSQLQELEKSFSFLRTAVWLSGENNDFIKPQIEHMCKTYKELK